MTTTATTTATIPVTITNVACAECPAASYAKGDDAYAVCRGCGHEVNEQDLGDVDLDQLVTFLEGTLVLIELAQDV